MATLTRVGSIRLRRWARPKFEICQRSHSEMFALPSLRSLTGTDQRWFRIVLLLCFLGILSLRAQATNFVVTKTADTNDGSCNADCSLREAIIAANSNGPGADTIT